MAQDAFEFLGPAKILENMQAAGFGKDMAGNYLSWALCGDKWRLEQAGALELTKVNIIGQNPTFLCPFKEAIVEG